MTLGELGERMSAQEFDLWFALHRQAPLGPERGDLQAGIIASTVANFAGRQMKDGKSARPSDFMPTAQERADVDPDPLQHFGAK